MNPEIAEIFANIPGMISREEGEFLYGLASNCSRGVIVEVGSSAGRSTACLARGSKAGGKRPVYAVDPHNGGGGTPDPTWWDMSSDGTPDPKYYINQGMSFPQFLENMKKVEVDDIVKPLVNYSELAYKGWNQPIELLFIDADHRFNYVKMDFEMWGSWVISGGTILLHDSMYVGVRRVINELILPNPRYVDIEELPIFHVKVK